MGKSTEGGQSWCILSALEASSISQPEFNLLRDNINGGYSFGFSNTFYPGNIDYGLLPSEGYIPILPLRPLPGSPSRRLSTGLGAFRPFGPRSPRTSERGRFLGHLLRILSLVLKFGNHIVYLSEFRANSVFLHFLIPFQHSIVFTILYFMLKNEFLTFLKWDRVW